MASPFEELLATIHTLRSPGGCPWDRKQNLTSAARFLMDEAGELVESALDQDNEGSAEELADLLFMTCFCTEILGETMDIDMQEVARLGNRKLIRRHPHVFGEKGAADVSQSQESWNAIKAEEKRARGLDPDLDSALKDMPASTAPLHQAFNYQDNASDAGFDWPEISGVWAKLREEMGEVEEAVAEGDHQAMTHEVGDLLFSVVNLARWLKIQPDMALRQANGRFRDRFHLVEKDFRERNLPMTEVPLAELEKSWQAAKKTLDEA